MPVRTEDLTDKLIGHLQEDDAAGYREALEAFDDYFARRYLEDLSQLTGEDLESAVEHAAVGDYLDHVLEMSGQLGEFADSTIDEFSDRLDFSELDVTVVIFPGLFTSNAFQGARRSKAFVGICSEHYCDLSHERCFRIPPEDLDIWLSHELVHAWRYTSTESGSLLANAALGSGFLLERAAGSFANSIFAIDEGIALHISRSFTGKPLNDVLGMSSGELEECRELWADKRVPLLKLLRSRDEEFFEGLFMSLSSFQYHGVEFPGRLGYFIGYMLVQELLKDHGITEEQLLGAGERELFRTVLANENIKDRVLEAEEK